MNLLCLFLFIIYLITSLNITTTLVTAY